MSAELILDRAFIDRFVKAIVPDERRVLLKDARSVAVLSVDATHRNLRRTDLIRVQYRLRFLSQRKFLSHQGLERLRQLKRMLPYSDFYRIRQNRY